jgi:hypothetical protein
VPSQRQQIPEREKCQGHLFENVKLCERFEQVQREGFLPGSRDKLRMHMHPFLLECGRVSDNAGLQSKQADTLGCSIDVVAKGLTAKGAFACRGKGVSLPDPREVGSDGVNSDALFYRL